MLTVHIYSFGFCKSGIPTDLQGHGGGHVFDCRCLPNPGKLTPYQPLTGLHPAVAKWLEEQPETNHFFASISMIVDFSIKQYQRRNLEHLMVSLGCTGGQHRSVYLAEQLGEKLQFSDLQYQIVHTEQENWPSLHKFASLEMVYGRV